MSDKFVMSARQSAELDFALERNECDTTFVKWLSSGDNLARVRRMYEGGAEIVKKASKILRFVGRVAVPATHNPINPETFFVTRPGLYVWSNFTDRIVAAAKCVKSSVAGAVLGSYDLKESGNDEAIRAELPVDHVFEDAYDFCVYLAHMIMQQPNGKTGDLLTNGYANIFYVRGVGGEVFAVSVHWDSDDQEWHVIASRLGGVTWNAGNRAFSSNC